ncbi:MAG: ATP-binding cassette domain-containing protein [Oscillochloris sp.]|nr:ATP-binding cassette domain-containing protein [Oscillochloris sp.]
MIEVDNLARRFGKIEALRDVSFSAANGRITGLLGPNGAGKTTTLRIMYALLQPDRGRVTIDGIDPQAQPTAARSRLGVLPDSRGLYGRLTSRENIRYFGRMHGLSGADLEQRIDRIINLLDMHDIADRRTDGFSQGQRVKVAIGRAIVHDPPNVVLDEPTNGLDVLATRAMRTVIRRLRDEGRCVLFSSHIMQEVAALCDQVVVIAQGTVTAAGSPDELRRMTGHDSLEDAFVTAIGSAEGLMA